MRLRVIEECDLVTRFVLECSGSNGPAPNSYGRACSHVVKSIHKAVAATVD